MGSYDVVLNGLGQIAHAIDAGAGLVNTLRQAGHDVRTAQVVSSTGERHDLLSTVRAIADVIAPGAALDPVGLRSALDSIRARVSELERRVADLEFDSGPTLGTSQAQPPQVGMPTGA